MTDLSITSPLDKLILRQSNQLSTMVPNNDPVPITKYLIPNLPFTKMVKLGHHINFRLPQAQK
jgi:hypothetical protein